MRRPVWPVGSRRAVVVGVRAVAALAVLGLVAWFSPVVVGGPLAMPGEGPEVCAPLPGFAHAALGVNLPSGRSGEVTVESVAPVEPVGVTLGGAYLMTVPEGHDRLMLDAFPPTDQVPDLWAGAVDAVGAVVPADEVVDLVVELEANGTEASLAGVDVVYSAAGRTYVARSGLAVTLRASGCG